MVVSRLSLLLALGGMLLLTACGSASTPAAPMMNHNRTINATLLLGSSSGDWPVFGYDPGHTGYVNPIADPHPIQGKLLWSRHLGPIFSSPVAGLGMLYIASTDGYLYALRQDSGAIAWRARLGDLLTDATPALEGQVLFVSVHGTALEALDAHTGQVYWTFDTGEKIQAPPLVVGSRLLIASRMTLWALDAASGRVLWKFHRGASGWPTTGSPAVAGDFVFFWPGTGSQLLGRALSRGHGLWGVCARHRVPPAGPVATRTRHIDI